jgi:hypothetical protein
MLVCAAWAFLAWTVGRSRHRLFNVLISIGICLKFARQITRRSVHRRIRLAQSEGLSSARKSPRNKQSDHQSNDCERGQQCQSRSQTRSSDYLQHCLSYRSLRMLRLPSNAVKCGTT